MHTVTIDVIREEVLEYCRILDAPKELVHYAVLGRENSTELGDPHIEIDEEGYHYVVLERGEENLRKTTKEYEELIYWIIEFIAYRMASTHAALQRLPPDGFFKARKEKHLELLKEINEDFYIKKLEEYT